MSRAPHIAALLVLAAAARAEAEPLRLRADAFASSASPVGLVDVTAGGEINDWLRADAVVWLGAGAAIDDPDADVLVIAAHARSPKGHGEATLGRFVLNVGALRPLHLDGLDARVHLPYRLTAEAFAGAPVVQGLDSRSWDWLAGGRIGRRLGDWGSAGVAFLEERDHGELSTQELGLDAGGAIDRKSDASARLAIDLISSAVALAEVSAVRRMGDVRVELYATHRSPSHLIPATSLFSVLGDSPAQHGGGRARWRIAPRLDLDLDAGLRRAGGETGIDITGKATLRLDDKGRGMLSIELRREDAPVCGQTVTTGAIARSGSDGSGICGGGWTGARGAARVPIDAHFTASTELELVRPDDQTRGNWWPWAIAALGWRAGNWDAALATEASASPEYSHRVDVIARLGRRWELP
ncbi:MAG: hypothetical protein K8W52_14825 [Deltaproteobacteria bacterium]|nr:hypothetical protein [Deltaproteobacteria bacterium]